MNEHLTERTIELYRRREIDTATRHETDLHLAGCEACLNQVLDSGNSRLAFASLNEAFLPTPDENPFHLSITELKQYNKGLAGAADQVICESHLEICAQCCEELRSLAATTSGAASKVKLHVPGSWPVWAGFTPARIATGIALLGLLLIAGMIWRQRSVSPLHELVQNPSPTTPVSASPGTANDKSNQVEDASTLAALRDGKRDIRLDREGRLTGLEDFDEATQQMIKSMFAGEALAKPNVLNRLSSPSIKLLGESTSENVFQLLSPLGQVISEQRPTLKWQRLKGASTYSVSVFDEKFNRVAKSPPLSEPVWTVSVPLPRGRTYSWEVTAVKGGQEITAPVAPAPRAQFRVLDAAEFRTLTKLKAHKPVSHLALGLMYAHFGLVGEAEREFQNLTRENPDSALAKRLSRTVQSWKK